MLNRKGGSLSHNSVIRVGYDLALECCFEMTCSFRFVLTIQTNRTDGEMAVAAVENGGELIRSLGRPITM